MRALDQPVPLEALADRAVRNLGHEKTVGSAWGGVGSFRDLFARALPSHLNVSDQPPFFVTDAARQHAASETARSEPLRAEPAVRGEPLRAAPLRAEPLRQEIARPEPVQQEAPRTEPREAYEFPRLEAPRLDAPRSPSAAICIVPRWTARFSSVRLSSVLPLPHRSRAPAAAAAPSSAAAAAAARDFMRAAAQLISSRRRSSGRCRSAAPSGAARSVAEV